MSIENMFGDLDKIDILAETKTGEVVMVFLDAEQITKNKLYIYTREKNTGFDRRFLMKRVGDNWMIDGVQERLDGWQRTGL